MILLSNMTKFYQITELWIFMLCRNGFEPKKELQYPKLSKFWVKLSYPLQIPSKPNITSLQRKILEMLQETLSVIFANSDKNLGPVALTLDIYIKDALMHLLDSSTYELLSEDEAFERDAVLRKTFSSGLSNGVHRLEMMLLGSWEGHSTLPEKIHLITFISCTNFTKLPSKPGQCAQIL